jgi:hypothetical protein
VIASTAQIASVTGGRRPRSNAVRRAVVTATPRTWVISSSARWSARTTSPARVGAELPDTISSTGAARGAHDAPSSSAADQPPSTPRPLTVNAPARQRVA